jgi:hypothetical protein
VHSNSNDFITAADDANIGNLGAMPGGGGTLAANSDNYNGSGLESGEPGLADNRTDWFYFHNGSQQYHLLRISKHLNYGW